MINPIVWNGKQSFQVIGTDLHEDTLRIRSNYNNSEHLCRLHLPTLCITYADMKFSNDIGGTQLRWPDSEVYGPRYFDPPVEIIDSIEIERLTWIRGAKRVIIGMKETEIEWYGFQTLVIPRLRISEKRPVEAVLEVKNALIQVEPELLIDITQLADGRSTGGVQVVKHHPEWHEHIPKHPSYRLWVRVVNFVDHQPINEAKLAFFRWREMPPIDPRADGFVFQEEAWTDSTGSVVLSPRVPELLEAVTLAVDGWRATAKVWRAQDNQPVNLLMSAARLAPTSYPEQVPGGHRKVFAAAYNLDPGDTLEWLAESFRYYDISELARMIGTPAINPGAPIPLPGWFFVHAQNGDTLESIASDFELEPAWARTTGRHHRPKRAALIEHEIVAVPSHSFIVGRAPA